MKADGKPKRDKVQPSREDAFQKKRRSDDPAENDQRHKKFKPFAQGKDTMPGQPNKQAKSSTDFKVKKKPLACRNCGSSDHLMRDCPKPKTCFLCHTSDHDHSECPKNPRRKDLPADACRACGQVGHVKRLCPNKPTHSYGGAAVCFVCQGPHLARYCNQNGPVEKRTCRLCKAVGHIKADCPQASKKVVFGKEGKEKKGVASKDSKTSRADQEAKGGVSTPTRQKEEKKASEGKPSKVEKGTTTTKETKKESSASVGKDKKKTKVEAESRQQKAK